MQRPFGISHLLETGLIWLPVPLLALVFLSSCGYQRLYGNNRISEQLASLEVIPPEIGGNGFLFRRYVEEAIFSSGLNTEQPRWKLISSIEFTKPTARRSERDVSERILVRGKFRLIAAGATPELPEAADSVKVVESTEQEEFQIEVTQNVDGKGNTYQLRQAQEEAKHQALFALANQAADYLRWYFSRVGNRSQ